MAKESITAYQGDEPYIFVSYAHADDSLVYPEIQWLQNQGFNVWFDEGISPGTSWRGELAEKIDRSNLFLFFVSPASVVSEHCEREVNYAVDHAKPVLTVHLSATELPPALDLTLGSIQAILKSEMSGHEYRVKLLGAVGKLIHRGIAPASPTVSAAIPQGVSVAALLALVAALGIVVFSNLPQTHPPEASLRVALDLPGWSDWKLHDPNPGIALSRDGQAVAYIARGEDGSSELMVRYLDRLSAHAIEGTKGAERPFFSPDGKWIGYFQGNFIRRVPVEGGESTVITTLEVQSCCKGATWGTSDQIVFAEGRSGLKVVSVSTGIRKELTVLDLSTREDSHRTPHLVAGHEVLLFTIHYPRGKHEIWARNLETGEQVFLFDGLRPVFTQSGYIVYARTETIDRGSLWAVPFTPEKMEISGIARQIQGSVAGREGSAYAIGDSGPLVYLPVQGDAIRELVLIDADGSTRVLDTAAGFEQPQFSNDGNLVAVTVFEDGKPRHIKTYEIATGASRVFVEGAVPLWGPDDQSITHLVPDTGLVRTSFVGSPNTDVLVRSDRFMVPNNWINGGDTLIYNVVNPETVGDLYALRIGEQPRHLFGDGACLSSATSDEKWLAFCTWPEGVRVGRYPQMAAITTVSPTGCTPIWSHDDSRLYYREFDKLVAVDVTFGQGIAFGEPETVANFGTPAGRRLYDIDSKGRLLLVRENLTEPQPPVLVTNWLPATE